MPPPGMPALHTVMLPHLSVHTASSHPSGISFDRSGSAAAPVDTLRGLPPLPAGRSDGGGGGGGGDERRGGQREDQAARRNKKPRWSVERWISLGLIGVLIPVGCTIVSIFAVRLAALCTLHCHATEGQAVELELYAGQAILLRRLRIIRGYEAAAQATSNPFLCSTQT